MTTVSTIRPLANAQYLVTGLEPGQQTVLDGTVYKQVQARKAFLQAERDFDKTVEEFYKDILEAQDTLDAAEATAETAGGDHPLSKVQIEKPVEGVEASEGIVLHLDHDGTLINAALNRPDLLIWVGDKLFLIDPPAEPEKV